MTDELTQTRKKVQEMPELRQHVERQKAQIDRLIAEREAYRRKDQV